MKTSFTLGRAFFDFAGGVDSVQDGHAYVEDHEIRVGAGSLANEGIAVICHTDNVVSGLEQFSDAFENERVIIGEEDSSFRHGDPPRVWPRVGRRP